MATSFQTSGTTTLLKRELDLALTGVEGWLWLDEAWELHEAARLGTAAGGRLAAEIGSYKGRSSIALAMGLRAAGGGSLIAVDPFDMEAGQFDRYQANIDAAGVRDLVTPIRAFSHDARPHVGERSVGVLFVDGSHAYEDVLQDIKDWESALADGAVVAFNDPYWDGVSRALAESIGARGSAFRRPRWVLNTLFVDYRPDAPWTLRDELMRRRLNAFLTLGRRWLRFHDRLVAKTAVPLWAKHLELKVSRLLFRLLVPRAGRRWRPVPNAT